GHTRRPHKQKSKKMQKHEMRYLAIIVAAACLLVFSSGVSEPTPKFTSQNADEHMFTMHVINVGQADAILLAKDNTYALIDAGETMNPPEREARERLFSYLNSLGVKRLEFLLLTHQDYDHIGNALDVLKQYDVKIVYDNGITHTTATYEKLMQYILEKNIPYRMVSTENKIQSPWRDVRLNILSPQQDLVKVESKPDINENSVVMKVTYKNVSYLLTGDAGRRAEERMLASGMDLKAEILKAGHHGSSSSSTKAFLNAVHPEVIVISVGKDNEYNHPHIESLERFERMTKYIYRTDIDGDIVVATDGENYSVLTHTPHWYKNIIPNTFLGI
ncbi:MAG TPA: MBL fold metallo-hydrolase, partial [Methanocorpusculum sp.]|nr:MBL fold metallo-hydrolase [Methanocorpusculum sp.]